MGKIKFFEIAVLGNLLLTGRKARQGKQDRERAKKEVLQKRKSQQPFNPTVNVIPYRSRRSRLERGR